MACSFMTGFFTIFDYFFDLFRPADKEGCYASCFNTCFGWFHHVGDVVRSDALTIVAISGCEYWESSRYC